MTGKPEERHAQLELCIPYVFGRLNPGNRKQFESHLATGCEQCKRELAGLYEATGLLPLLLKQETPPPDVRQRLLSRISSKKPEPQRAERVAPQQGKRAESPTVRPERPWYLYVSLIIGALLIVALVIFVNELVGTTTTQEKQIADLRGELLQNQDALGVLKAEKVEEVTLAGAVPGSSAYGKILWDPARRAAILQVANLPVPPQGNQYQLWVLKEKKYLSAGLFDVTREKDNELKVMTLPVGEKQELENFTVTVEPKGGSGQPTGAVQLRGSTR